MIKPEPRRQLCPTALPITGRFDTLNLPCPSRARNGAGNTFTEYNVVPAPLRARDGQGKLSVSNRPVMGSAVGHNCRLGSGLIIYPSRTIESDVVLAASKERRVVDRDVRRSEEHTSELQSP